MTEIDWILTEDVRVTRQENGSYRAEELEGNGRTCVIAYGTEDGEMRFDGEFICTEDFMGFVGLLDVVDESPTGVAVFKDETVSYEDQS